MKTFIFTFVLLAGHSFWETKAQASENSGDCFWKFVKAAPTFFVDFEGVLCKVTSEISQEEKAEQIKNFANKYSELLGNCDFFKIFWLNKEMLMNTAEFAADIVDAFSKASDKLGFTNELIQILCNPDDCAKKVAEGLKALKNTILDLFKCKKGENQEKSVTDLIFKTCLPKTLPSDIAGIAVSFINAEIMKNDMVKDALQSFVCPKKPEQSQS
ncbi:uncharacterized protein [Aquarana catesbeiana]|uniref:uncharacterized protein n=1 Tax=Aquarana catesbeiana TaxID=8400 RepID=UPI003CC98533